MTSDDLLAEDLLKQWLDSVSDLPDGLVAADRESVLASPGQRGLWLAQEIQGDDATAFATRHSYRITGPLDRAALARAVDGLVERHEVLRTGFRVQGEWLTPVVGEPYSLDLRAEPLLHLTGHPESDLRATLSDCDRDRLDLATGRVMRARLFELGPDEHVLVLTIHHVAVDGWSLSILQRDLAALYVGDVLEPQDLQYLDFAEWQREQVTSGNYAAGVAFWTASLGDVVQPMPLPTDRPRPSVQSFDGSVGFYALPADVVRRVGALAGEIGATPHIVTLAVFVELLARWTGTGDLVVGTAVNHRPLPETEDMVGPFASIMPVRYRVDGDSSFRAHLAQVKASVLGAREHEDVPFELIVEALGQPQSSAYNPLVQVTMTYKSGVVEGLRLPRTTVDPLPTQDVDVQRDLAVEVSGEDGDRLTIAYASDLWDVSTIDALAEAYTSALRQATADPDAPLRAMQVAVPTTTAYAAAPLPSATATAAGPSSTAPGGDVEPSGVDNPPAGSEDGVPALVRSTWLEVMKVDAVESDDDFFDVGGESLKAMRICNQLATALDVRIPLRTLFENSTFEEFAAAVEALERT